jgi:hypothetical protein
LAPTYDEMKRRVRTTEGIDRVLNYCLPKAGLTEEQVKTLLKGMGPGRKAGLAWALADLDETSATRDPKEEWKAIQAIRKEQGMTDPLSDTGKAA